MLSIEGKQRLIAAGMFALPLFLVKFTGVLFTPSGVEATTTAIVENPALAIMPEARKLTLIQQAAIDRVEELRGMPFGPSPLFYHQTDDGDPVVPLSVEAPTAPTFTVGAIMEAASGDVAAIEGTYYREGDMLGETGWRVIEIDAVGRSVTIESETGEQAVRFVANP
jgi:hypothetical protein